MPILGTDFLPGLLANRALGSGCPRGGPVTPDRLPSPSTVVFNQKKQVLTNIHFSDAYAAPPRNPLVRVVTKRPIGVTYWPFQGDFLQTRKVGGILG